MCAHYRYASSNNPKKATLPVVSAGIDHGLASAIADAQRAVQLLRIKQEAERAKKMTESTKSEIHATPADTSSCDESETVQQKFKAKASSASSAKASSASSARSAKASSAKSVNTNAFKFGGDVSSASASRKFQMTKQTKLLIQRQKMRLPEALEGLKNHRRKVGHWAWW